MKNEENKKQDPNIDLQQDAKNLVLQELEKIGVINYMRANIKKSILDIIEKEKVPTKQKLEFDFMTPLHRLNKTKEILITCHLIKDFLKFYELDYTFPIFENESNVKENIKRETLFKECKLKENKEEPKPVLLQLVTEQLNRKDSNPLNQDKNIYNQNPTNRIDFSNYSSVYNTNNISKTDDEVKYHDSNPVIPGKIKLDPISFSNKSIEVNNDSSNKFNTFNISDAYKRDKDTNINNNINNIDNENKNITAQDILSKGRGKINNNDIENNNNENNIESGTPMIKKLANAISQNTTISKTVTTTNDGKTTTHTTTKFVIDKNNDVDGYDGEFDISEEIDNKDKGDKGDYNEESKKSFGGSSNNNIGSFGFDSSVVNFNENDFDYIEDVDKP